MVSTRACCGDSDEVPLLHRDAPMEHSSDGVTRLAADPPGGAAGSVADGNAPPAERRDNVAPRMAVDVSVVRDTTALQAIEAEWRALAGLGTGALFRGPDWLIPWWQAYHATLAAELNVVVGRAAEADGNGTRAGDLVCLAPLYRRTVKVALLDTRELRMIGDAG